MTDTLHDIEWVQKSLNRLGVSPPLAITGELDDPTIAAVLVFQRASQLREDGRPGLKTQAAIEAALKGVDAATHPTKETKPMPASTTPAAAPTQNQTVLAILTKMEASVEPAVVAVADKALPWFVPTAMVNGIIHDGLMKGVAMAAGATAGVMQSLPTAQQIVATALDWAHAHTPNWLKEIVAPIEELVVIEAQKLGVLPPEFCAEHMPKLSAPKAA